MNTRTWRHHPWIYAVGDCSHRYELNTVVQVTATALGDSTFSVWSGCSSPPILFIHAVGQRLHRDDVAEP